MANEYSYMDQIMPLREEVFYTIREAILKGDLKPGTRLKEIALANEMGVSRTPVRDAIRKLELEGLVVIEPNRGACVSEIARQELHDVLELRRGLEELAIRKACERITPEELENLEVAAEEFRSLVSERDLKELAEADVHFHDVIYRASHNRRLVQILNNLREQMYRFRMEYLKDEAARKSLDEEHHRILEAVRSGDIERAHNFICQHIDNQYDMILKSLKA